MSARLATFCFVTACCTATCLSWATPARADDRSTRPDPDAETDAAPNAAPDEAPSDLWIGARFAGAVLPQFWMNVVGEGGDTLYVPGAAVTLSVDTDSPQLVFGLAYASYGLGETAFKPHDAPDTDWEIIESDLMSLGLTMDVMWLIPVDPSELVSVRLGFSFGLGIMFAGDLGRTQSYPESGQAGDPETYLKCGGPNDPEGTFRYCNQLDKDGDHYDGFVEPTWFEGGARPLLFPTLAIPIGVTIRPFDELAIDVETGFGVTGFLTQVGARYGL